MITDVAKILQRGITFVFTNVFDQSWFGVPLATTVFALFVMSMVLRFVVMPLFGSGYKGAGSDFVKNRRDNKDE